MPERPLDDLIHHCYMLSFHFLHRAFQKKYAWGQSCDLALFPTKVLDAPLSLIGNVRIQSSLIGNVRIQSSLIGNVRIQSSELTLCKNHHDTSDNKSYSPNVPTHFPIISINLSFFLQIKF